MRTYIVNLKQSTDRKEYMLGVLNPYSFLNVNFIEGVDGRVLSSDLLNELFDQKRAVDYYGRECTPGEVGCTLSHQKCYQALINSDDEYALILEDDVIILEAFENIIAEVKQFLLEGSPTIILLSGGFWYTHTKKQIDIGHNLVNIHDALFTHSYIITKSAAKLLIEKKPFFQADNWRYIKSKGVRLVGVLPRVVTQEWDEFQSLIADDSRKLIRKNMSLKGAINSYYISLMRKLYAIFNHFEKY